MFIELWWPERQAINFHEDLYNNGTIYYPPILPPVVEIKDPSDDQESLLLIDIACASRK